MILALGSVLVGGRIGMMERGRMKKGSEMGGCKKDGRVLISNQAHKN